MRTVAVTDIFNYTERLKFVRGKGSDGREHGVQRIESIQSFGFSTINNYWILRPNHNDHNIQKYTTIYGTRPDVDGDSYSTFTFFKNFATFFSLFKTFNGVCRLDDRSIDVAEPRIWNKLPATTRLIEDFGYLKLLLKAHSFD